MMIKSGIILGSFTIFAILFFTSYDIDVAEAQTNETMTIDEINLLKEKYTIFLKNREYMPVLELETDTIMAAHVPPDNTVYFLMQFESLPDIKQKKLLEGQGIDLVNYVSGNTYIASTLTSNLGVLDLVSDLQAATALNATDKISPNLQDQKIGDWSRLNFSDPSLSIIGEEMSAPPQNLVVLTVEFNGNVDIDIAEQTVSELGGQIIATVPIIPSITAVFDIDKVNELAQQNTVQFIDLVGPPLDELNDQARTGVNVNLLNNPPYELQGSGVNILVYDGGVVERTHPDFGARIIEIDSVLAITSVHATHVAGTVGGSGFNSDKLNNDGISNGGTPNQWAGMAPQINIRSFGSFGSTDGLYDTAGDLNTDFTSSITNGIDLSTMSLGMNVYKRGLPCDFLGDYSTTARVIDTIVTGAIGNQNLIFFQAAGNERGTASANTYANIPAPCGHFGTITSPAPAKNSIVVGAVNSNDFSISFFTSFGPTDDGRIKPDIVAPGCQTSGDKIKSTGTRHNYIEMCGTSMATPAAAGAAALLVEKWKETHPTIPMPHTIKAILLHSADDAGNPGPDYKFGWGILDAKEAIDLIKEDETNDDIIRIGSVDVGGSNSHSIISDGTQDLKVTLVWDDEPASRLATRTLVNDLNLEVIDPDGTIYRPFVLDPQNEDNVATIGVDDINNVEMVIADAKAGTWTARVIGAHVPIGPQEYTLVSSAQQDVIILITYPVNNPQGSPVQIDLNFMDNNGNHVQDVNYDIIATQGITILDETGVYDADGTSTHTTIVLPKDASDTDPIDIKVTFNGIGLTPPFTGPIGYEQNVQVVPEFGTFTIIILALSIVTLVVLTSKDKIILRSTVSGIHG